MDEIRRQDRRDFLKRLAGKGAAVAAGAVVANGLLADGAGAAENGTILIGSANNATNTGTTTTTLSGSTFAVNGGSDATNLASVRGIAGGTTTIGVAGNSPAGPQLRAEPNPITDDTMPPTTGAWQAGSLMATTNDVDNTLHDLWYCYADGVGSNSGWYPLSLIPAFIPLDTPQRIYNSLDVGPPIGNTQERNIDATTGGYVPPTAFAVMFSFAVFQTVNNYGFLSVFPGSTTWPGNSNINWFGSNQILATNVVTLIDDNSEFTVHCGTNGSTHFVVDMLGYYTLTA